MWGCDEMVWLRRGGASRGVERKALAAAERPGYAPAYDKLGAKERHAR